MKARRPARDDRRTPRWFFDLCVRRFGPFSLDAAATKKNRLCTRWLGPGSPIATNALTVEWSRRRAIRVWLNCPYGPTGTIPKWIAKARQQRDRYGTRTLMLLPADTSTEWYHDVTRTELCELVPFRLAFGNGSPDNTASAKFGSLLVWIAPRIVRPRIVRPRVRSRVGRTR